MNRIFQSVAVILMANFLAGASCFRNNPDPVDPPVPSEGCAGACAHMLKLECPEGAPLEDGTTCETFCTNTEAAGHALDTECVMGVTSCEELHSVCGM